ncbi:MAG: Rieske (2Fe-2S) protein [Rhodocyclales bacterium]|nr:Rieske (2Fe-2S) protein [Rhodocyclales bacterium]
MAAATRLKRHRVCASGELAESGAGVRFTVDRPGGGEPAFVVRDWQQGEFFDISGLYLICATHGALYAPDSGRCLGGRCNGKGLVALAVVEDDGQIFLVEEGGDSVGQQ